MPIGEIIEKSFKYPWKNRALWFYGVLLSLFAFGSNLTTSYSPTESEIQDITTYFSSLNEKTIAGLIAIGVVLAIIWVTLSIIGVILTAWSQVAIAKGTTLLEAGKTITRKDIGKTGKTPVWNMIVLDFFIPLGIIFGLLLVIGTFIALCVLMPQPAGMWVGIIVGLLAFLFIIAVAVYLSQIWLLARRFVALDGMKAIESLKAGVELIKGKFWWTVLLGLVLGMVAGAAGFIGVLPLLLLGGIAVYLVTLEMFVGAIITGLLTLILALFFIVLVGYFVSFQQVGQTIWWQKLKEMKKEKPTASGKKK